MKKPLAIILAAGQGTRMKSDLPKVLHPVCGISLVGWVLRSLGEAGIDDICVVVGHRADLVQEALGDDVSFAVQSEQLGTAHAVMCAGDALAGASGSVLILAGDVPMLSSATMRSLVELRERESADLAMATFRLENPTGYGRIVRNDSGAVVEIVEQKDASDEQKLITEVNPAVYCFDAAKLRELLPRVGKENAQGEYYLPDLVKLIVAEGGSILAVESRDADEFLGINDRWQLAEANDIMRRKILRKHGEAGVSLLDINSITIGPDVEIGRDAVIHPNTVIDGVTQIGSGCAIGPNSWIKDSMIGERCRVFMSHLDGAMMEDGSRCGPFSNLRPDAVLRQEVKIGNFVEIKNSEIGSGTSISHLTYIGDAKVGERSNIGAGVITCNYDGFNKFCTEIGDECFVGSNSTLVAPVKMEDGSFVAAGSVITRDVPSGAMAVGRGRQENKEQWYTAWRERKISEKK
ncbi:MAG: bifunctional UDP-N-acetylglucosamine diphosphorylase/glucosamine-1-phosphate N-acetyltransferase GlmU [Fimbriimonadaceae bacterium]